MLISESSRNTLKVCRGSIRGTAVYIVGPAGDPRLFSCLGPHNTEVGSVSSGCSSAAQDNIKHHLNALKRNQDSSEYSFWKRRKRSCHTDEGEKQKVRLNNEIYGDLPAVSRPAWMCTQYALSFFGSSPVHQGSVRPKPP